MKSATLDLARAVLDGRSPVPHGQRARCAAFLARQACEAQVNALCAEQDPALCYPVTMRSRLTVLGFLHGPDIAGTARLAWHGLSEACHYHAYELTPTVAEIGHLIDIIATLPDSSVDPGESLATV